MEKTANQAGNNLNEINTRHDYVFHLYAITNTKKGSACNYRTDPSQNKNYYGLISKYLSSLFKLIDHPPISQEAF